MKIIAFFLIALSTIYPEGLTFEKEYNLLPGYYVQQTHDGGYIVSSYDANQAQIVRMNKHGELLWKKKFDVPANACPYAIESSDNKILYITSENKDFNLVKLNDNGDVLWKIPFFTPEDDYGLSIIEMEDGNILAAGFGVRNSRNSVILIKTNSTGKLLWEKNFIFRINEYKLLQPGLSMISKNDSIFIMANKDIYILNSEGESLGTLILPDNGNSFVRTNDGFIVASRKHLFRINDAGQELWDKWSSRPISGEQYSVCEAKDGNFAVAGLFGFMKINLSGDTLWYTPNYLKCNFISRTSDDGFIMTAQTKTAALSLLKCMSDGFFTSIKVVTPKEGSIINSASNVKIEWIRKNVQKTDVQYSTDSGVNWHYIMRDADTTFVNWKVPFLYSSNCFIKVIDKAGIALEAKSGRFTISALPVFDSVSINNITMCVSSDGISSHDVVKDYPGTYWKGVSSVYTDGLLWAGKKNGKILCCGANYRTGLKPGRTPEDSIVGIYKLRHDISSLPDSAIKYFNFSYDNWPGDAGAPFRDINRDGKYQKNIDQPLIKGDESLWFVSNDFDTSASRFIYGSDPIGLEIQSTIWAYNRNDELDDVVFKKYKLVNKSGDRIEDMYMSQWSDVDLGYAADDCVGCDTVFNMGYFFNGDNDDEGHFGQNPPAVGYKILQGPVVPGLSVDSAFSNDRWQKGKTNLNMTAFYPLLKTPMFNDVDLGSYYGTIQTYFQMQGKLWDGSDIVNQVTGHITKFPLSGDPVDKIGWYDGEGWPGGPDAYDRRFVMTSGPFNLAETDTQEIVIALIFARGTSNINSIAELRRKAQYVQDFYDQQILTEIKKEIPVLLRYSMQQNYPNPFNPSTTIKYSIPEKTFVELSIYDILGKRVMNLINEEKPAGEYLIDFNARSLASGVYYYQIKTAKYTSTKKMLLIK